MNNIQQLLKVVKMGDVDELKRLIAQNNNECFYCDALSLAARHGCFECVKILVSKCILNLNHVYEFGLIPAVEKNHVECINYLLSLFTKPFDCSQPLEFAVKADSVKLIQHFVPLCGDQKYGSAALVEAIINNNKEFFELLLPVSDPNADNDAAFRAAVVLGYTNLAEILYPLVNVPNVEEYIRYFETKAYDIFRQNLEVLKAKMQKDVLNANIGEQILEDVVRKM